MNTPLRTCANDGCTRPHHARGLCNRCYHATRIVGTRRPHAVSDQEAEAISVAVEGLIAAVRNDARVHPDRAPLERIGPSPVYQELERLLAGGATTREAS